MTTPLKYGFAVNKNSSLEREWITLHDPALPADFVGTAGAATMYKAGEGYSSGEYNYRAKYKLEVKEPLAAFEVVLLTFDIWGEHVRTLSTTEIADLPAGQKDLEATWSVFSENEVSEYYASIAYVARVRTKGGRVLEADKSAVVAEAQKLSAKFSAADLESPKPTPKP